jgi:hypothetical protein
MERGRLPVKVSPGAMVNPKRLQWPHENFVASEKEVRHNSKLFEANCTFGHWSVANDKLSKLRKFKIRHGSLQVPGVWKLILHPLWEHKVWGCLPKMR